MTAQSTLAHVKQVFNPKAAGSVSSWIVFLLVLAWLVLLMQGLPLGDPDDWDHILFSEDTSWGLMLKNLVLPWSTSTHWVGQTDIVDQTVGGRLFHGIALKAVVSTFGHHALPFYVFNKAIFFAGTVTFLYLLLLQMTRSRPFAAMGTVFYGLVPSHYSHVFWNSVPETMVHFFLLGSIFAYVRVAQSLDRKDRSNRFWFWLALLVMVGWLCCKTKETAIILPLSLGVYTAFRFLGWRSQGLRLAGVVSVIFLFVLLVVPITSLSGQALPGQSFSWDTFSRMLFRNYECGYDDELTSAFFSTKSLWPVSIARTIGFYLLWTLVGSMVFYLFKRVRGRVSGENRFLGDPLVGIAACWIPIELFLIGHFQPDPRYFSGTMIPLTILGARLLERASRLSKRDWHVPIGVLMLLVVGSTVVTNFQHVMWLRQQIGQRNSRINVMAGAIYRDQFPERDPSRRDIGLFYGPTYIPDDTHPRLEKLTYHVAEGHGAWNKTAAGAIDDFSKFVREGAVYYVTKEREELANYPDAKMVMMLSGINDSSFFERVLYRFKRKQPVRHYIFRHVEVV